MSLLGVVRALRLNLPCSIPSCHARPLMAGSSAAGSGPLQPAAGRPGLGIRRALPAARHDGVAGGRPMGGADLPAGRGFVHVAGHKCERVHIAFVCKLLEKGTTTCIVRWAEYLVRKRDEYCTMAKQRCNRLYWAGLSATPLAAALRQRQGPGAAVVSSLSRADPARQFSATRPTARS
jgi:hypothetical protein